MNLNIDWPNRGHGYSEEDLEIVEKIIYDNSSSLSKGKYVQMFEDKFSELIGYESFTTMSGAHALDLSFTDSSMKIIL